MNKSPKQISLENKILDQLKGKSLQAAEILFADEELQAMQDYANNVSIKRLGYNDHGPVHMRKAALNALKMFNLLENRGVKMSLEKEGIALQEDSMLAVFAASLLHDLGMTVTRDTHEILGLELARPFIEKVLNAVYSTAEVATKVAVRAIIQESIFGHMATRKIHSIEAGLVLVGDGSDMEHGRARITALLSEKPRIGDIHKYSSTAIDKVIIDQGEVKPIRILVKMNQSAGLFQIEEVLYPKIASSPIKEYIELYGQVEEEELLKYI
ncbi:MAG TPA: phosphohydrolase [Candidatus Cloacimonadota bacterium]|nr:phosphohydrolase [Candidatus Cloacimonadota bacterium]HOQ80992.1 phosphohydrolase [Candidatus Cloacimonadota bacterium]HPK40863.1 phosphohydrolase [Candidatus Cloacimonadota bacterium]